MFSLGDSEVYYLSRTATDMRKGFDALCGEVRRGMGRDPISGEVFIFYNAHRTRLKLLHWERVPQAFRAGYSYLAPFRRPRRRLSGHVAGTGADGRGCGT